MSTITPIAISSLPAKTSGATGSEEFAVNDAGTTKKLTLNFILEGVGLLADIDSALVDTSIVAAINSLYALDASASQKGLITTGTQVIAGSKTFNASITVAATFGLILKDDDASNTTTIKANSNVTSNWTLRLPATAGTNGYFLQTNGSGVTTWAAVSIGTVTSVASGTGLTGGPITGSGTLSLATSGVGAGTYAGIVIDSYGRATSASHLTTLAGYGITDAQPLDDILTAITNTFGTGGIISSDGVGNVSPRTILGTTDNIGVDYGDGIDGNPTIDLIVTAVTAASYGSSTSVATFTVDEYGRLTAATTVAIPTAATGTTGLLTSTDWNTFNSKLTSTLTSARVFVGNGSNVATGVAISGDITISNTGAVTIANSAITNAKVSDVAWSKLTGTPTTLAGYGITNGQPLDDGLTALAAYNTNGFLVQTTNNTFVGRTLTVTAGQLSISNGDGVLGNPVLSLATSGATAGTYTFNSSDPGVTSYTVVIDAYGRITSITVTV